MKDKVYPPLFQTVIISLLLVSCGGGGNSSKESDIPLPVKQQLNFSFDFAEDEQEFLIDAADFAVEHPLNSSIEKQLSSLPVPYEYRQGIKFSWNNYNQDIKGFIKKKVTGLKANSEFEVDFSVNILTYMSEECLGVGGSPGRDVTIKAGVLPAEPIKMIDESGLFPTYRLNISDDLFGGEDTVYLGNIGLPILCDETFWQQEKVWEIKSVINEDDVIIESNTRGDAWLYLSLDSGVGSVSEVYIIDYQITINEL